MTKTLAEVLILASLVINAALLTFIAGVLRKVMNDMGEHEFKRFVVSLVRHSKRSPFLVTVLMIPFFGAIPYFYFYGFANWWLIAALALWLIAGAIGKLMKLPIYRAMETGEATKLGEHRRKLNAGNMLQAILNSIAALLALVPFVHP